MEILRRVFFAVILFFIISVIVYFVMHSLPGDPILMWLGAEYNPSLYAQLRTQYGLDKPLIVQYLIWLKNLLRGDLGTSLLSHIPVSHEILRRIPITLELIFLAMIFSVTLGMILGILSAFYRDRFVDQFSLSFTLFGISVPEFFFGALLVFLFSLLWRVFPPSGYVNISESWLDNLHHMIMPAVALGFPRSAVICRMMRSSLLEVFGKNYIRTAIAKGLKTREVLFAHAFKNALINVVTVIGLQIGYLVGGSIVVEKLFVIPGIGSFGINAILARDYPGIQGFILVVAFFFVVSNFLVDLIYLYLDPRIRYGGPERRH